MLEIHPAWEICTTFQPIASLVAVVFLGMMVCPMREGIWLGRVSPGPVGDGEVKSG